MKSDMSELFLFMDIVKGALLRRMARESLLVLSDGFLEPDRRAQSITLYERVGNNFVTYIAGLHKVKSPPFLQVLVQDAMEVFQDNLDKAWIFSYDGHCESINWLPTPDRVEGIINEF